MGRFEREKRYSRIIVSLGHVVLHLMDVEMREQNDLETLWCVGPKYDDQIHEIQQSLEVIKKMDEQLKEEEVLTVADKYRPLDNPFSHVRYPLEGPGVFQDLPPRKEVTSGDVTHKKHEDEQVNLEVEKELWIFQAIPNHRFIKDKR